MNTQPIPSRQSTLPHCHPLSPDGALQPAANAARLTSLPPADASEPAELASVAIRGYN